MRHAVIITAVLIALGGCTNLASRGIFAGPDPEQLDEGPPANIVVPPIDNQQTLALQRATGAPGMPDSDGESDLNIHILNIGSGSCQIIDCPDSDEFLVADCGSIGPTSRDMNREAIKIYMDDLAFDDNDVIVTLSHPDRDHINRIETLMEGLNTKSIWLGGDLENYRGSAARFLERAHAEGTTIHHGWQAGFSNNARPVPELSCGSADTYILTVNSGRSKNAKSLMLMLEYGDFSIVFSGDAEGVSERAALAAYGDRLKDITIVTASHHGAVTHGSNHSGWINALDPQIVVYSSGVSHGHPIEHVANTFRNTIDADVAPHEFWTAETSRSEYVEEVSSRGEYVTELNGRILIQTNGKDFKIDCSHDPDCF